MARLRQRAATPPAPALKPPSAVTPDGIRFVHIKMDPLRYVGEFQLPPDIMTAFVDGLLEGRRKALARQTITSGRDE